MNSPDLGASALALRASRLRLLISDVDGVLTDGGVYYSEQGEELKRFSVRDGMGVERLRAKGIETALLTREPSAIVARRAEKLRISLVYLGVPDKALFLRRILDDAAVTLDQVAYIGDDVNDAGVMDEIAARGLIGAPADARPEIRALAHHKGTVPGGHGAFREFAEWLLGLRDGAEVSCAVDGSCSVHGIPLHVADSAGKQKEGDA
ncbi:MAG: 3-deoxy-D-manno-octulosonate 8-phosphate phosphatase [Deltaproteobacteria bacterium]|nr:3-deoxy-D-manno-octulosonate 8-phosphate phosphatase [Deltaproteobacteria bacterium]